MPERFSWILPDKLAVGSFPYTTTSVSKLRREGITAVLCLNEESEPPVPSEILHSFIWERVPIPDGYTGGVPSAEQFEQALNVLNRWYKRKHTVYVHCLAGVGRSASVCALYLAQAHNIPLADAIATVRQQHKYAAPDSHQVKVMQAFLASLPSI
ncbi:MAG: dual specificity protein phosphatase family protein [Thermosynechococcaceae cyanobacterium]